MYNITLIGTRHEAAGKCNSDELYKIIERINPELIFEEIPPSLFAEYYTNKTRTNLETDTINKYIETYKAEHILIDSDDVPSESFFWDYFNMLRRVEGLTDVNGFNYRNFIDRNRMYIETHGLQYLNSVHSININDEITDAIEKGLGKLNSDKLNQTYKVWKEVNEKRENTWLQNIYSYSKEYSYDQAVFIVGAGHRKSLMQKIDDYEKKEKSKLNWGALKL